MPQQSKYHIPFGSGFECYSGFPMAFDALDSFDKYSASIM